MKLSQILFKEHKARLIRKIWQVQAERSVTPTRAVQILSALNVKIEDAVEVAFPPPKQNINPDFPKKEPEKPKDYNDRSAFLFNEKYFLQAGMSQAQALTKTILVSNELPESITEVKKHNPKINHQHVERLIKTTCIFDAQQEKLPIVKDPERPAWVFPRSYGITASRKMNNLARNLLQYCEILSGTRIAQQRNIVQHGYISCTFDHGPDVLSLAATIDFMITSTMSEKLLKNPSPHEASELPDLHPLHHMLGLTQSNIYKQQTVYPIHETSFWLKPHTIILHHDPESVKNLTELPVREDQILSQALMKSFITAASYARIKYGNNVKELTEPVTVQCIQTNGQKYNFGALQLNTLNFDRKDGLMNYWWFTPNMELYSKAQYERGKPVCSDYNPEVFETLLAFYKNQPGIV